MRKAIVNGIVWAAIGEKPKAQTVIIEGNLIKEVGYNLPISDDTTVVDAKGCWVTPGFIDVHTHLGVHTQDIGGDGHDFNETVNPCTPEVRAIDAINPFDSGFADARKAGITTVQVLPGSANVIGGETCVIKTVGHTVDEMVVQAPSAMKAALGENPKRVYGAKGKSPATRMGVAAILRQELMKAQDYAIKKRQGKIEFRDLGMEQMVPVVEGALPMRVHVHRADDIITMLRIANEFSIQMTLEHVTEGHLVAEVLAESGFRFTIGPTFSSRSKQELAHKSWETVQCFAAKEVPFSITTDHPVVPIEHLITTASHALKYGISEEKMMEAITIRAAEHLQLDSRLGTIEVGKDADIVIWTGAPLAAGTSVKQTFINGAAVYTSDGLFT